MRGSILATRHAKSSPQPSDSYPVLFNPIAKCYGFTENIYRGSEKGENRTAYAPASLKYRRMSSLPRRHWRRPKQTANKKKTSVPPQKNETQTLFGWECDSFSPSITCFRQIFLDFKRPKEATTLKSDDETRWESSLISLLAPIHLCVGFYSSCRWFEPVSHQDKSRWGNLPMNNLAQHSLCECL